MLNTNTVQLVNNKQLQFIPIDYDNFINQCLPSFIKYLQTSYIPDWQKRYGKTKPIRFSHTVLAVNAQGKLDTDDYNNIFYGSNTTINIAKRNYTVAVWAKKILEHYIVWLKKQQIKQANMSKIELAHAIRNHNYKFDSFLFTEMQYANYLLANLEQARYEDFEISAAIKDPDFANKLLVRLNSIKQIRCVIVESLLDNIGSNYQKYDYPIVCETIKKLYQILFRKDTQVNLIGIESINYPALAFFTCHVKTSPKKFVAAISYLSADISYYLDKYKQYQIEIDFNITNEKDLEHFLQQLVYEIINGKAEYLISAFKQITTQKVQLGKYKPILDYFLQASNLVLGEDPNTNDQLHEICHQIFTSK